LLATTVFIKELMPVGDKTGCILF